MLKVQKLPVEKLVLADFHQFGVTSKTKHVTRMIGSAGHMVRTSTELQVDLGYPFLHFCGEIRTTRGGGMVAQPVSGTTGFVLTTVCVYSRLLAFLTFKSSVTHSSSLGITNGGSATSEPSALLST